MFFFNLKQEMQEDDLEGAILALFDGEEGSDIDIERTRRGGDGGLGNGGGSRSKNNRKRHHRQVPKYTVYIYI